ncbi:hypothetical protein SCLCIDRAFT_19066 [Scleroderma citrinum Foug A]|uniref:Uncharacterized protein n=1 Tax=Scleroderma citrinum Foug A TaxID=1036808 RepID=A0A0C3EPP9_9AGAM|nr:hypothetical protein SCLCIDRAFT_19066 [Scleroderma citrinum Foug A]
MFSASTGAYTSPYPTLTRFHRLEGSDVAISRPLGVFALFPMLSISRFRVVFKAVDVHAYGWCIRMGRDTGRHLDAANRTSNRVSNAARRLDATPMARLCPDDHCGPSGLFQCRSMCSKRSSGLSTRRSGHPLDPSARPLRRSASSMHRFASPALACALVASSRRLNESLAHPACSPSSDSPCTSVPFARTTSGLHSPFRRPSTLLAPFAGSSPSVAIPSISTSCSCTRPTRRSPPPAAHTRPARPRLATLVPLAAPVTRLVFHAAGLAR